MTESVAGGSQLLFYSDIILMRFHAFIHILKIKLFLIRCLRVCDLWVRRFYPKIRCYVQILVSMKWNAAEFLWFAEIRLRVLNNQHYKTLPRSFTAKLSLNSNYSYVSINICISFICISLYICIVKFKIQQKNDHDCWTWNALRWNEE